MEVQTLEVSLYYKCICRAVCRHFAKGGGGGANLGYLKKEAQLQATSGGALENNV